MPNHAMVDVHCHILPGLDDGPKTMGESLSMVRMAYEQGIRTFVATPHLAPEFRPYTRGKALSVAEQLEREARDTIAEDIRIHLGQELFSCSGLLDLLEDQERVIPMAESEYILLEFLPSERWQQIRSMLRECRLRGYQVIIAHMERYKALRQEERLQELKQNGVLLQMNYRSLAGGLFDRESARCRRLVQRGYIDLLGTDMHNTGSRAPETEKALRWLTKNVAEDRMEALVGGCAERLLLRSSE